MSFFCSKPEMTSLFTQHKSQSPHKSPKTLPTVCDLLSYSVLPGSLCSVHAFSYYSLQTLWMLLSPSLCIGHPPTWNTLSPDVCMPDSFSPFKSLFKCHHCNGTHSNHVIRCWELGALHCPALRFIFPSHLPFSNVLYSLFIMCSICVFLLETELHKERDFCLHALIDLEPLGHCLAHCRSLIKYGIKIALMRCHSANIYLVPTMCQAAGWRFDIQKWIR